MAGKGRAAYDGRGTMSVRTPGVWRLRVMTGRGQVERIFRGSKTAAREALIELAAEKPSPTADRPREAILPGDDRFSTPPPVGVLGPIFCCRRY